MPSILILFAHPLFEKSKVHSKLIAQASTVKNVTINDLYQLYPDFDIDIEREQELLLSHDIIIWQHPFYWYSAPALLKQWLDLVLEHGWAYGKKGRALEGKKIFNAFTSGAGTEAYQAGGYNKYPVHDYLLPFRRTAELCRMEYYPPFWVPGTHKITESLADEYAEGYKSVLTALVENHYPPETIMQASYMNDLIPQPTTLS